MFAKYRQFVFNLLYPKFSALLMIVSDCIFKASMRKDSKNKKDVRSVRASAIILSWSLSPLLSSASVCILKQLLERSERPLRSTSSTQKSDCSGLPFFFWLEDCSTLDLVDNDDIHFNISFSSTCACRALAIGRRDEPWDVRTARWWKCFPSFVAEWADWHRPVANFQ